jgi:anti-anti-sigma factor
MDIDIIRTREPAIVHCCGRLVFGEGADRLRDAVRSALSAGQDVVLDLGRATQVDAHGAGVLAELLALSRHEGRALSLAGVNERVRRVLQVTGLESVVRDAEECLASPSRWPHALDRSERARTSGLALEHNMLCLK